MTRLAAGYESVVCVGVGHAGCYEVASADGVVVGDGGWLAAVAALVAWLVEERPSSSGPCLVVPALRWGAAYLLGPAPTGWAAPTVGQLEAVQCGAYPLGAWHGLRTQLDAVLRSQFVGVTTQLRGGLTYPLRHTLVGYLAGQFLDLGQCGFG